MRYILIIIFIASCNLQGELHKYDWQIPIEINTLKIWLKEHLL